MTRPGFLSSAWAITAKDLRLEWRTWESVSAGLVFSLTVLLIFVLAFDATTVRDVGSDRLIPGVIWIVLGFTAVVGMARSFQIERDRGAVVALFLAPIDRGAIYTGKLLANLIKITLMQWILVPVTYAVFDYDLPAIALPMAGVLLLHTLGLAELGTLFSAVTMRLGRGEALLAILLFPAAAPLFLSAFTCTEVLLRGEPLSNAMDGILLSTGFVLLYFFLSLLTFEFVLED